MLSFGSHRARLWVSVMLVEVEVFSEVVLDSE